MFYREVPWDPQKSHHPLGRCRVNVKTGGTSGNHRAWELRTHYTLSSLFKWPSLAKGIFLCHFCLLAECNITAYIIYGMSEYTWICAWTRVANIRLIFTWNILEFGKSKGSSSFCLHVFGIILTDYLINPPCMVLSDAAFLAALRNAGSKSDKKYWNTRKWQTAVQ